jgi:hypothetical protein
MLKKNYFRVPSSRRGGERRTGAGAALPANASTLRIAMTAADIPLTLGQPDQGFEGNRFTGIRCTTRWLNGICRREKAQRPGAGAGDRVAR